MMFRWVTGWPRFGSEVCSKDNRLLWVCNHSVHWEDLFGELQAQTQRQLRRTPYEEVPATLSPKSKPRFQF